MLFFFLYKKRRFNNEKAFTLAEVLITLGVIGIVAALTMPALIANYQKKVLETRIKKFISVINQANTTRQADIGDADRTMLKAAGQPAQMEEFFNVNFKPYLKTTEVKPLTKGIAVSFPDGSGAYFYDGYSNPGPASAIYSTWCVNYKDCKNIDETVSNPTFNAAGGKTVFDFLWNGNIRCTATGIDGTRQSVLDFCASNNNGDKTFCTCLLQMDGWEVKPDYPWF